MASDFTATGRLPDHADPLTIDNAPPPGSTPAAEPHATPTPPWGEPLASSAPPWGETRSASMPPYGEPRPAVAPPYATPTSGPAEDPYGGPFGAIPPYRFGSAPTDRRRRRQHWAGAILIVIGLLILGSNLGLLRWARPEYVIPMVLIVAGAWLLFGRGRRG